MGGAVPFSCDVSLSADGDEAEALALIRFMALEVFNMLEAQPACRQLPVVMSQGTSLTKAQDSQAWVKVGEIGKGQPFMTAVRCSITSCTMPMLRSLDAFGRKKEFEMLLCGMWRPHQLGSVQKHCVYLAPPLQLPTSPQGDADPEKDTGPEERHWAARSTPELPSCSTEHEMSMLQSRHSLI